MSIMDTLITNRTQADVIAGNAKGNYNASDLNRVGAATEYLHDLFESYGYSMPNYKRIKLSRIGHYEIQTVTKPILPDGYTQLEYIESTGTQYINTEFVHSAENASLEIDFSPLVVGDYRFCGAYKTNSGLRTFILDPYNSTLRIGLGSQDIDVQSIGAGTRYNVSLSVENGSYQYIVNSSTAASTYSGSIITGLSFYLFAVNLDNAASYYASMKLYSCKLYQSDVLVRDLVPAKRNSDGVLGLYDLVNDVFCTNEGTGEFTAGPENIEYETITEEVLVPDERDPYTWFEDDIPTSGMMAQYITNLSELRGQFVQAETTPSVPTKMDELTWKEANNIEKILEDVNALLTNIATALFYSGDIFSGEV